MVACSGCDAREGTVENPRYGPLQRWSAVAIDAGPLPERRPVEMDWLPDFCASCRLCVRACPGKAILDEPIPGRGDIVTHIDNRNCEPYFGRYRGCNVCIKVCATALRKEGLLSG